MASVTHTSESFGALDAKKPRISSKDKKINAKLAYTIYTGIVKNKVAYAIREICKNAWEATLMKKNTPTFSVHLPTTFNPRFSCRDYGPGLSHHFMRNFYGKIGHSTKDGDGIGGVSGWGYGKFAPFAYLFDSDKSGAFMVISHHKGMKRTYTVSLDEDGEPLVEMFGEEPTTETGLEVSFPVSVSDIAIFLSEAENILWSFDPRPVCNLQIFKDKPVVPIVGSMWKLYPSDVPFSGPHIKVGPIMYPIDMGQIDGRPFGSNQNIVFEVGDHDISPTASREDIQYTSTSKKMILGFFEKYKEEFFAETQKKIDVAKNYFEACIIFDEAGYEGEVLQVAASRLTWKGLHFSRYSKILTGSASVQYCTVSVSEIKIGDLKFRNSGFTLSRQWFLAGKAHLVVDHSKNRSVARLQKLVAEKGWAANEEVFWIRARRPDFELWKKNYGFDDSEIIVLDSIKVPQGPKQIAHKKRRVVSILTNPVRMVNDEERLDLNQPGGFYFYKDASSTWKLVKYRANGRIVSHENLLSAVVKAASLGIDLPENILVMDKSLSAPPPGWQDFGAYLDEELRKHYDPNKAVPKSLWKGADSINKNLKDMCNLHIDWDNTPVAFQNIKAEYNKEIGTIIKRNDNVGGDAKQNVLSSIIEKISTFPVPPPNTLAPEDIDPVDRLNGLWSNIIEEYPFMKNVLHRDWSYADLDRDYISHYLGLLKMKETQNATHSE